MTATESSRDAERHTLVAWSFVAVQAALLIAIVVGPRDETWRTATAIRSAGLVLFALGAAIGLWAAARLGRGLTPSPLPNGQVELVTLGPYRWVRHPMYTAVMLIAAAIAVRAGSIAVVAEAVALVGLFNIKARWEEGRLAATFAGYDAYMAATPRFLPRRPRDLPATDR